VRLKSVEVFDVYTGAGVDADKKSVAINLMVEDGQKTLEETDITELRQNVLTALEEKNNATLRG